ncbi:MAG: formate dehydrogenase accessory sulfurtransferase FdhD [Polyangiales bacterium]
MSEDDLADSRRVTLVRLRDGARAEESDLLAAEEPLAIRVNGERWMVTLRTPGDDLDLVMGLLWSDAVIARIDDADVHPAADHTVDVVSAPGRALAVRHAARATTVTAACGMCGRHAIDDVCAGVDLRGDGARVSADALLAMTERLREAQGAFSRTGGVHAAGLFTASGELLAAREDVGRHNAVDKVIGATLRRARSEGADAFSLAGSALVVTGRAGFEIVQKAARAGVPVVCAVSAPTTLSVELARRAGITLAAFARGRGMNLYAHPERVT